MSVFVKNKLKAVVVDSVSFCEIKNKNMWFSKQKISLFIFSMRNGKT